MGNNINYGKVKTLKTGSNMIEYSAIAESSAVILTIYFLFFPITLSLSFKNLNYLPLPIVRLQLLIIFLLFGITAGFHSMRNWP